MTLYTDNTDVDVDDYYDAMSSMDVDVDVDDYYDAKSSRNGGICFWMSGLYGEERMWRVLAFFERYIYM